jgi:dolichol-phosphate mannosyltransferase
MHENHDHLATTDVSVPVPVPVPVPEISVVVPLWNEQENLESLYRRLTATLRAQGDPYELVFVDDGSRDATPRMLDALFADDPSVVVVHLSRNFGHQPAVTAGLECARGRAVIVMDGDLQDPPEVLPQFIKRWRDGYDVVYAVRTRRKENLLLRACYFGFYRLLRMIGDLEIPLDSGDFCLMDRRVVDALRELPEQTRFVRGLRTYVGFRQVGLEYERAAREAGRPKYSFSALVRLAVDGLISFSSHPLRLAAYVGLATAGIALALLVWVFYDALINHTAPRGWASLSVCVLFIGAMQLLALGVIGEYIRLIFLETKRRPSFIIGEHKAHRVARDQTPRDGDGNDSDNHGSGGMPVITAWYEDRTAEST